MRWCSCSTWVLIVSIRREFLVSGTSWAASESNHIVDWTRSDKGWFMFTKKQYLNLARASVRIRLQWRGWAKRHVNQIHGKAICRYNLLSCLLVPDLNLICLNCVITPNIAADGHKETVAAYLLLSVPEQLWTLFWSLISFFESVTALR